MNNRSLVRGRRILLLGAGLVGALVAVGGLDVARALSPSEPLVFTATLRDAGGAVVTTTQAHTVTIGVYDAATAGAVLCSPVPTQVTTINSGQLSLPLGGGCGGSVMAHGGDAWVAVSVSGPQVNANFPRIKLHGVPYALEAVRATVAHGFTYTNPATGQTYTETRGYCGLTGETTGAMGGYAGAAALCRVACASNGAHMCTMAEVTRILATGGVPDGGPGAAGAWISMQGYNLAFARPNNSEGFELADCKGYTSAGESSGRFLSHVGLLNATNSVSWRSCYDPAPVMCCD